MKQFSEQYEDEVLQGDAMLCLAEYISRPARQKLVKAIHSALDFKITERKRISRKNGSRVGRDYPTGVLAKLLNVHNSTVWRWVTGGIQACNVNAEKVIKIAFLFCPEEAVGILYEDLETHRFYYGKMADELSQGGARLLEVEVVA